MRQLRTRTGVCAVASDAKGASASPTPSLPAGLRAVPGLASLPVVFAALTFFPRVGPWGFLRLCRSLRAVTRVRFAASRPCARPRFRPCALAPSALPPGGWVGVPSCPCRPLPAGASAAPAAGGWWLPLVAGVLVGVRRGRLVSGFVSVSGGFSWFRPAAFRSVVASAGRFGAGRWCLPLAGAGVRSVVFGRCGRRGFRVVGCRVGFCGGLVVVGRLPARRPAVSRCRWPCVWRLGAGRLPAVAGAGRSRCPACGRWLGAGVVSAGFVAAALPPLPVLVASVSGCRSRWLVRGSRRALAVRCGSPALAALLCRRARAFGLPPLRVSARLVLLPVARVTPPSPLSLRFGGPPALSAPPSLPGLPLPVLPRGGRSSSPARRPGPAFSFKQGRLF